VPGQRGNASYFVIAQPLLCTATQAQMSRRFPSRILTDTIQNQKIQESNRLTEVTRHFTATTFVVQGERVLLHRHLKQGLWLPPGGHIERDELPHVAAVREVEEETGLRIHLHSESEAAALTREMACEVVPQPAFILVEDINPFHQHIDFTYFARLPPSAEAWKDGRKVLETNGFNWFSPDELVGADVPENVRVGAQRAIQYYAEREESR
jgi:8-oxo-dGTP pyrophosphatase MutT (NUDIX family)